MKILLKQLKERKNNGTNYGEIRNEVYDGIINQSIEENAEWFSFDEELKIEILKSRIRISIGMLTF